MQLAELVEFMVEVLVDETDAVEVREIGGEQTVLIEVKVAKRNMGQVIGKQGRTATALRTVLEAAAAKIGKRVMLDIVE